MKIKGLQKTSLIDYSGKVCCTIFLFGCNFRCGFCHNPELVRDGVGCDFSEGEILNFLKKRSKYLDAVCFTGGEPLISLDRSFVQDVKKMGYLVKIDTNGSFPEQLKELISEGFVDYVAMDVKAGREKYKEVIGTYVDLSKIEESIKLIAGLKDYEFRTTILEKFHDEEEVKKMVEWVAGLVGGKIKKFALQGFKKEDKLLDESFKLEPDVGEEYLQKLKKVVEPYCESVDVRM